MQWADDHFPPIQLQNELKGILELIGEVRRLRKLNAALMITIAVLDKKIKK